MPKRNIVWVAIGAVVAMLLWKVPENILRRDALYKEFGPLLDVRVFVVKNYVEEVKDEVLLRGAIDGMTHRLDPYSEYFPPEESQEFHNRTEGQFEGIGVEVEQLRTGELLVVSPIEGSPAFRAGLRPGDRILKIEQTKTSDLSLEKAIGLIRGRPGTSVRLTIHRPGVTEPQEISVARAQVTLRSVRGWSRTGEWQWDYVIDPEYRIGYVRIFRFERLTTEQLDEVMSPLLSRQRIRALIIDVRDNPGGLLPVVVDIANRFLRRDARIVSTKGRRKAEEIYRATGERPYPNVPVVILVNEGSASASEILAGALKDNGRATLVGERTFGKGSVQELFEVPTKDGRNGQLKLTTSYYYLPNGERIHGKGVEPDVLVELSSAEREARVDAMRSVYSGRNEAIATQPATTSAPGEEHFQIAIDRQLQTALDLLRQRLATQPAGD